MIKTILKGITSSERFWLTVSACVVLGLSRVGVSVGDEFTTKFTELVMVLVASLGIRAPRVKQIVVDKNEAVV